MWVSAVLHHTTGLSNELSVRLAFDEISLTLSHHVPIRVPFQFVFCSLGALKPTLAVE